MWAFFMSQQQDPMTSVPTMLAAPATTSATETLRPLPIQAAGAPQSTRVIAASGAPPPPPGPPPSSGAPTENSGAPEEVIGEPTSNEGQQDAGESEGVMSSDSTANL